MKFKFLHTNHYSLLLVFSFDPLIENKQLCFQRVELFISSPGGGGTKSTHNIVNENVRTDGLDPH